MLKRFSKTGQTRANFSDEELLDASLNRNFDLALVVFTAKLQERVNKRFNKFPNLLPDKVAYSEGVKYYRVYSMPQYRIQRDGVTEGYRSVVCFVDKKNGDILFPKAWEAPQKRNPRGNVFSDENGMEAIDDYGFCRYLR